MNALHGLLCMQGVRNALFTGKTEKVISHAQNGNSKPLCRIYMEIPFH